MTTMTKTKAQVSGNEIMITRTLNAPRELVWETFTKPEHIKNWWGPNGFTNTIFEMDVRAGGTWDFIMHGPDGTDYKNTSVYSKVVKPELIIFDHVSGPKFTATISFEEKNGKTILTWRMRFESIEQLQAVVKQHKADEGLSQNIDKLEEYLANR